MATKKEARKAALMEILAKKSDKKGKKEDKA